MFFMSLSVDSIITQNIPQKTDAGSPLFRKPAPVIFSMHPAEFTA